MVDSAVGARLIAGDFNLLEEDNPYASHWQNCGFVEVQTLWARLTGQPLRPTCKGCTRKDFLYLSAELVSMVVAVTVEDDWFADHSLLLARLEVPGSLPRSTVWRMPRPRKLPADLATSLPAVPAARLQQIRSIPEVGSRFAAIWAEQEDLLSHALVQRGLAPLTPAERGRGCTTDISVVSGVAAPIRKGRLGEVSPQYFGANKRYAHWFRQLRRLQALLQAVKKGSATSAAAMHRASTWHAVLHSPGFSPSFASWWPTRGLRLQHAPTQVPLHLPGLCALTGLFQCFEANFRSFEKELLSHRRRLARVRRAQLPMLVFRDIQRARSCPVTTLVEGPQAAVCHVDEEDFSLSVEPEQEWIPNSPFFVDGRPTMPIHVEPDKIWLDHRPSEAPVKVHQERHLATLTDLFRAFGEAWSARWLRHSTVTAARWREAIAGFSHFLPPASGMPYVPISVAQWRATVFAKRPSSAPGPDGVSRLDLALMPDDLLALLLEVCEQAERSGAWPMAAMNAIVSALEKLPGAERVGQFRPIAVLSFVYRIWASCRSKEALRYLTRFAPEHMFGMMPGKSSQSVWYLMQHWIETAHLSHTGLCGVVADLVKAFNYLPRLPVLAFAVHVGIPVQIVRAWTSALCLLQRRFKVRNCVGPPIGSTTGFPEGDPMSCVGMSLVCLAYHAHLAARAPRSLAVSYVDNWEGVGSTVEDVCQAHQAMLDFCAAWDVQLDESKTVFWATLPVDRRALRQKGLQVLHHTRELGGHLQFTRASSNSTLTARIQAMDEMWPRLASSHSPYRTKVRALIVAAWPRGLYGSSICTLGQRYISHLRTSALRGLGAAKPGASAPLHLALIEGPASDPGYVLFRSSVMDLRQHLHPGIAMSVLDHLASGTAIPCPGPGGIFLQRIHEVGWTWDPEARLVQDEISPFDLWSCSPQELHFRLGFAWRKLVARQVCQRSGFAGLQTADWELTRRSYVSLPHTDQAAIRIALNGTFFTQDALKHFDEAIAPHCRFCGEQDSVQHRVCYCPFFAEGRESTGFDALLRAGGMPAAQKLHAWGQEAPSLSSLRAALLAVPTPPTPGLDLGGLDVFTDGSCTQPPRAEARLASWAVTCHPLAAEPWTVACGPLPGLIQSAFRAKLFAIVVLFRVARASSAPFRVWTDCLGVVRKLRTLQRSSVPPSAMAANGDLWLDVWTQLQDLEVDFCINHVPSHEDLAQHTSVVDKWVLAGNHHVDRVAALANLQRHEDFWTMHDGVVRELDEQLRVQTRVVAFHRWMALRSTRSAQPASTQAPAHFVVQGHTPLVWPLGTTCRGRSAAQYGSWFTDALAPWLHLVTDGQALDLGWISWIHLMVDFMLSTGLHPPLRRGTTWIDERVGPAGGLYRWDAASTSRAFARQVRFVCTEQGQQLQTTETRSVGAALNLQTSCLWARYPKGRLDVVDGWMVKQLGLLSGGALLHRHSRTWKRLPRPTKLVGFAGR